MVSASTLRTAFQGFRHELHCELWCAPQPQPSSSPSPARPVCPIRCARSMAVPCRPSYSRGVRVYIGTSQRSCPHELAPPVAWAATTRWLYAAACGTRGALG
jgi:hypothetical protein